MVSWKEEKFSRKKVWFPILKTAGSQKVKDRCPLDLDIMEITGEFSKIKVRRGIQ